MLVRAFGAHVLPECFSHYFYKLLTVLGVGMSSIQRAGQISLHLFPPSHYDVHMYVQLNANVCLCEFVISSSVTLYCRKGYTYPENKNYERYSHTPYAPFLAAS